MQTLDKPFRNGLILYPLKTPDNQRVSVFFRGYKMGTLARNGLKKDIEMTLSVFTGNFEQVFSCLEQLEKWFKLG